MPCNACNILQGFQEHFSFFFRVEADNQFYYRLAYGRHFLVYNILQLLHTASIVSIFPYVSLNTESNQIQRSMKLDLRIASRGNSTERGAGCCSSTQCCGYEWHGTTGQIHWHSCGFTGMVGLVASSHADLSLQILQQFSINFNYCSLECLEAVGYRLIAADWENDMNDMNKI